MKAKYLNFNTWRMHVSKESRVADHCRQYALSDPSDRNSHVLCEHQHIDQCDRCDAMEEALLDIKTALAMIDRREHRRRCQGRIKRLSA